MRIVSHVSDITITELGKLNGDTVPPALVESVRVEVPWGSVMIDNYSDGTTMVYAYSDEKLPTYATLKPVGDHGFKISTVNGKV